ncbi:MAG TPA: hypothetical protein VFF64_02525 [Candidatus Eremiobacteraceae bacterium]|nr:hypothetical protein [Candidatus Eremiobacteraceae bacterium]
MPMLDDDEYRQVMARRPIGKGGESVRAMFIPMLAEYERITGLRETNPNAVFHHRLSKYGPPCRYCGKPLRTPQAKLCGYCMKPASDQRNGDVTPIIGEDNHRQWCSALGVFEQRGKSGTAMSTIEEVRAAEKKVQKVLDALKKADARDAEDLSADLTKATDEYAKAVRELRSR